MEWQINKAYSEFCGMNIETKGSTISTECLGEGVEIVTPNSLYRTVWKRR